MNKSDIIQLIAQEQMVETLTQNIAKKELDDDLRDLCQDIYIALMEKPESLLKDLYTHHHLRFYISRMLLNNINSKNSPFYYNYKKNQMKQIPIDDITI